MKNLLFLFFSFFLCYLPINAEIIKITQIEDVIQEVAVDTLVLFNIAEVLMDTETSLGTQEWRKYIRTRAGSQIHDELTLFVFKHVPAKTPEPVTAEVISMLQKKKIPVLAFTSRGRHEWYSSQIPEIDLLTEKLLGEIGIDFSQTVLPESLLQLDSIFDDYYYKGIIYATNAYEKGEFLNQLLKTTHYQPSKIVFIDDKAASLKTVQEAAELLGIPFIGYAYSRTAKEHAQFDPMIAHIQLDWLITCGKILSDQEARQIKEKEFANRDSESYFYQLLEKWETFKSSDMLFRSE